MMTLVTAVMMTLVTYKAPPCRPATLSGLGISAPPPPEMKWMVKMICNHDENNDENRDGEVDDDGGVVLPSDWRKFPRPPPLSSLYSLPPLDLFVSFNVDSTL